MNLTIQQERKLKKIVSIVEKGPLAVAEHLFEIEQSFEDKVNEIKQNVPDLEKVLKTVKGNTGEQGPQGEVGPQGERGPEGLQGIPGEKGDKGERGERGPRGEDGLPGLDGVNGVDGKDGKDGKDGSPDTAEQVRDKLQSLKGAERLSATAIKDLPQFTREIIHEGAHSGAYETPIKTSSGVMLTKDASGSWVLPASTAGDSYWQRSGTTLTPVNTGDTVQAALLKGTALTNDRAVYNNNGLKTSDDFKFDAANKRTKINAPDSTTSHMFQVNGGETIGTPTVEISQVNIGVTEKPADPVETPTISPNYYVRPGGFSGGLDSSTIGGSYDATVETTSTYKVTALNITGGTFRVANSPVENSYYNDGTGEGTYGVNAYTLGVPDATHYLIQKNDTALGWTGYNHYAIVAASGDFSFDDTDTGVWASGTLTIQSVYDLATLTHTYRKYHRDASFEVFSDNYTEASINIDTSPSGVPGGNFNDTSLTDVGSGAFTLDDSTLYYRLTPVNTFGTTGKVYSSSQAPGNVPLDSGAGSNANVALGWDDAGVPLYIVERSSDGETWDRYRVETGTGFTDNDTGWTLATYDFTNSVFSHTLLVDTIDESLPTYTFKQDSETGYNFNYYKTGATFTDNKSGFTAGLPITKYWQAIDGSDHTMEVWAIRTTTDCTIYSATPASATLADDASGNFYYIQVNITPLSGATNYKAYFGEAQSTNYKVVASSFAAYYTGWSASTTVTPTVCPTGLAVDAKGYAIIGKTYDPTSQADTEMVNVGNIVIGNDGKLYYKAFNGSIYKLTGTLV